MDLVMYVRYKREGGSDPFFEWEFSAGVSDWEQAAAPAQIGRRVVEGVFGVELSPRWARVTNNLMHWGYGMGWGAPYGVVAGSRPVPRVRYGLLLGPLVWTSGYVVLPLAKLYKPIWDYDAATLARDLSAHLVYGIATAAAFRVLTGRRPRAVTTVASWPGSGRGRVPGWSGRSSPQRS
jgi:hypothetical protein